MKSTLRRLVPALAIAMCAGGFAACGDDTTPRGMPTGGSGGSSGNGGSGGTSGRDGGGSGGTGGTGGIVGDGGDSEGPVIVVTHPMAGQLVGGVIQIEATITDDSGVDANTVHATVSHGGSAFTFRLTKTGNDTYGSTFNTRTLPNPTQIQFPAVEVVADDIYGNHSTSGGIEFSLDNVPPIADLDPAVTWLYDCDVSTLACECGAPMDVVGDDAMNDLDGSPGTVSRSDCTTYNQSCHRPPGGVQSVFFLRAEAEDFGNAGTGSPFSIIAKVGSMQLAVLDDTSQPLVVDSDGDGTCDMINPHVRPVQGTPPTSMQAVVLQMVKVPSAGGPNDVEPYPLPPGNICVMEYGGGTATPPLCNTSGSSLTYVVTNSTYTQPESLLWALPPVTAPPNFECLGLPFDALANNISDGWICAAVEVYDNVGNRSVSAPIRLCVDKNGSGACANPGPAPNCTGTYNPSNDTVTPTPCTPVRFGPRTVRDDGTPV